MLQYRVLCNSGQNIHDCAVAGVVQAPIRFFDVNPAGRILNRFRFLNANTVDMAVARPYDFEIAFVRNPFSGSAS